MQGKCTSKNLLQDWIEDLVWTDCEAFINQPGEALRENAAVMETKRSYTENLDSELILIRN